MVTVTKLELNFSDSFVRKSLYVCMVLALNEHIFYNIISKIYLNTNYNTNLPLER
jgi:hypothetical protein